MLRSLKYFVLKFCWQGAKTFCLCLLLLGIFLMTVLMSSSREPRLHSSSSRVSRKNPDPVSGSLKSLQSLEMVQTAEALLDSSLSSPQSNQELYRWAAFLLFSSISIRSRGILLSSSLSSQERLELMEWEFTENRTLRWGVSWWCCWLIIGPRGLLV